MTIPSQISLITRTLVDYVERETWQISAIKQGIQAADRGEFASDAEVKARFARWGVKLEESLCFDDTVVD